MSLAQELQPANKVYFHVAIMDSFEGKHLKKLTPDADGYFHGVPLSAINAVSFNDTYYDPESHVRCITDVNSACNIKLRHGNLYGEWGHPKSMEIARVCEIDRDRESHHFIALYTEKVGKSPVVFGDLKPTGPYGRYLESSLLNPRENTAFSLRCIMVERYDKVLQRNVRYVEEFVTYDSVDMPGYIQGSKWFTTNVGKEMLVPITLDMLFDSNGKRVGLESYTDKRILELFGVDDFKLGNDTLGNYFKGTNTYRDSHGVNRSIGHQALIKNIL